MCARLVTFFVLFVNCSAFCAADELFDAIGASQLDVIEEYLSRGGDPDVVIEQTRDDAQPGMPWRGPMLEWAVYQGSDELAMLLLRAGAQVVAVEEQLERPFLELAAEKGMVKAVRHFATQEPATLTRGEPLVVAVAYGRGDVAGLILAIAKKNGIDLDSQLDRGFFLAAMDGHDDLAQQLLEAGADVNSVGALHAAARGSRVEVVRHLLDAHADPEQRVDGLRPLDLAILRLDKSDTQEARAVIRELSAVTPDLCEPLPGDSYRSLHVATLEIYSQLVPSCHWTALVPLK